MSFYGNSYVYTAESFAQVVLRNLGIDANAVPLKVESSPMYLTALNSNAALGVATGNHWISLEKMASGEGFTIKHNKPYTGTKTTMVTPDKVDKTESIGTATPKKLDFQDYIKIPVFYYDAAGHVSGSSQALYFQLPENPVGSVTARMNQIENRMDLIDGDQDGSLKKIMEGQIAEVGKTVDLFEEEIKKVGTAESNAQTALKTAQEALKEAGKAMNYVDLQTQTIANIISRLDAIGA